MWAQFDGEHVAGAAKRRRERRHRAYLQYARMSVAMALSEYKHHTSRGQRMARAREGGHEEHNTATFLSIPPPRRQALSSFPLMSKMSLPPGRGQTGCPLCLVRKSESRGAPWSRSSTACRLSLSSTPPSRTWWTQWWTC